MDHEDPISVLTEQLKSPDDKVRLTAVEALGKHRDARAVESLLPLARDRRWEVQGAVAEALGLISDLRALDTLKHMYDGETYSLIESDGAPHRYRAIVGGAAIALARLYRQHGDSVILDTLINRFQQRIQTAFDGVGIACTIQGLPYTNDRQVTPLLIQAAALSDPWVRYCAMEALGVLGDPAGLPTLFSAVQFGEPLTIVIAAADALALFRVAESENPLVSGFQRLEYSPAPKDYLWYRARTRLARALGIIGTPRAQILLKRCFDGPEGEQRIVGAVGLTYMGERHVLETLCKGLSVGDIWTQAAAAEALGVLGDRAAIPALRARLPPDDGAKVVKDTIRAALQQLDEHI
ncbi:MAG: HEAT repeat domain-containing protein [Anaerolineae bacterium]|nr:HEAT repeat domain-containing protein [Anaerolineae bacterium]